MQGRCSLTIKRLQSDYRSCPDRAGGSLFGSRSSDWPTSTLFARRTWELYPKHFIGDSAHQTLSEWFYYLTPWTSTCHMLSRSDAPRERFLNTDYFHISRFIYQQNLERCRKRCRIMFSSDIIFYHQLSVLIPQFEMKYVLRNISFQMKFLLLSIFWFKTA